MPSHYAHYRFGKLALPSLPPEARQCIQRFRRLYDMGQQGPDFFFYYNPFWATAAGDLGQSYHHRSGLDFFPQACAQATSEAARAYLFGLLGHYCLDSISHPLIERKVAAGEANHVRLEKEFDRFCMEADGISEPAVHDMSDRIRLTRGECVTVAGFYPPATPGQVNQGVKLMSFIARFLARKNREELLEKIRPSFCDHLIPQEPVEEYTRLDSELLARFHLALKDYPVLAQMLLDHIQTGTALGEEFLPNFG